MADFATLCAPDQKARKGQKGGNVFSAAQAETVLWAMIIVSAIEAPRRITGGIA